MFLIWNSTRKLLIMRYRPKISSTEKDSLELKASPSQVMVLVATLAEKRKITKATRIQNTTNSSRKTKDIGKKRSSNDAKR